MPQPHSFDLVKACLVKPLTIAVREVAMVKTCNLPQINLGERKQLEKLVLLSVEPQKVRGLPAILPEGFTLEGYQPALNHIHDGGRTVTHRCNPCTTTKVSAFGSRAK